MADKVFDTSDLTVHDLRRAFMDISRGRASKQLSVTLVSFGYKHGVPLESDLLLDVRFLPNPHFVPALRSLTGRDRGVQEYIEKSEAAQVFLDKTTDLLRFLIPQYAREGKSYLTVGVGCTGGRHRSVMIAERLRRRLGRPRGCPATREAPRHLCGIGAGLRRSHRERERRDARGEAVGGTSCIGRRLTGTSER